jgi:hypothetical protein
MKVKVEGGLVALHAVITPGCRVSQGGPNHAFDEAARRLREEYLTILQARTDADEINLHLVLVMELPAGLQP